MEHIGLSSRCNCWYLVNRQIYNFVSYILRRHSIWFLYFGSNQFRLYYFQFGINFNSTVNLLAKNVYVANVCAFSTLDAIIDNKIIIIIATACSCQSNTTNPTTQT